MHFFDLRTAYFIMGVLYFFMPVAVWLALRGQRSASVNAWCGGGLLFGCGLFFLGLRGSAPEWMSYELVGVCMNAGQLLRVVSLRRELQRPLALGWPLTLLAVFTTSYALLRWHQPLGPLHYQLSLAFMAWYFGWIALLALQLARQERLTSAYWLALGYTPLALLLLGQLLIVSITPVQAHPLQSNWSTMAVALMGNVAAVIGNTSFMGMFVERATRRQLADVVAQTRAAENQRLGRQIARLDRMRGLGMVSASLAHELSQPMTSVQLSAEQAAFELKSGAHDPGRTQKHLEHILRQAQHAREVLQRIRRFVQPEPLPHDLVSLQGVNASVLELLKDWLQTEQVAVGVHAPTESVSVEGDAVQLAQILMNVYRNAIEATAGQSDRRIFTRIALRDGQAHITVQDNGPGFSPEALAHSQEGFFSSKRNGLGMGLVISRQIAEMHQGDLQIDNAAGGGACIRLQLPVAAGAGPGPASG